MKWLIITFLLSNALVNAQDFGSGYELIPAENIEFKFYANYNLTERVLKELVTEEDVLQQLYLGKDIDSLQSIYTDISDGLANYIIKRKNKRTYRVNYNIRFQNKNHLFSYYSISIFQLGEYKSCVTPLLIKEGKKWKVCGKEKVKTLKTIPFAPINDINIGFVKSDVLYHLVTGELSGNAILDSVIKKTRYNNSFDIDHFLLLTKKWKIEKDNKKLDYFFYSR